MCFVNTLIFLLFNGVGRVIACLRSEFVAPPSSMCMGGTGGTGWRGVACVQAIKTINIL